jgi:hypothetical protein
LTGHVPNAASGSENVKEQKPEALETRESFPGPGPGPELCPVLGFHKYGPQSMYIVLKLVRGALEYTYPDTHLAADSSTSKSMPFLSSTVIYFGTYSCMRYQILSKHRRSKVWLRTKKSLHEGEGILTHFASAYSTNSVSNLP